jgi:protein phosphatase 2C-like protein
MWAVTGAHVTGTSHARLNTPCQDYCAYERAFIGSSPVLIIAIADGAGSATLSHIGSRATVEYILRIVPRQIGSVLEANMAFTRRIFSGAREHLQTVALDHQCNVSDLACTTLFAVLSDFGSFFAQIGDGAWVIRKDGQYSVPIWPDSGEYVNETTFLTSPNWEMSIRCHLALGGVTAVAGFTDGLQRVALQINSRSVFVPFFEPLFCALSRTNDKTELISPLVAFLTSKRLAERTDDDKSLVLACYDSPLMLGHAS